MSQSQTAESVETEAARVRAQLVEIGTDLRVQTDPAKIVDAAKASFSRRAKDIPALVRKNASPVGLVLLGGVFGVTLTGVMARSRKSKTLPSEPPGERKGEAVSRPNAKSQAEAALLSCASLGLGYIGGFFIPSTPTEEKLLGEPKAIAGAKLDEFLHQHRRGMKLAAANLFGASRLSATALIAMAAIAEAIGASGQRAGRERP